VKEDCATSLAGEDNELESAIRASEHRVIEAALRTAPNRIEAAKVLGISPRTLRYKLAHLRDHGLPIAAAK
jgi:two-component system, response regulator FlrC